MTPTAGTVGVDMQDFLIDRYAEFEAWIMNNNNETVGAAIGQYAATLLQSKVDAGSDFGTLPDDLITLQCAIILGGPIADEDYELLYEVFDEIYP